jgi:hypothetical protein
MSEKPILFTGEMVRAILEGRKTETRRVVKPQPREDEHGVHFPWATFYNTGHVHTWDRNGAGGENWQALEHPSENKYAEALKRTQYKNASPYGQPGDRLWVRETWATHQILDALPPRESRRSTFWYHTCPDRRTARPYSRTCRGKWRPSIHMPRWASRINLEVTEVRVERVQDITEDSAAAEGVERTGGDRYWLGYTRHGVKGTRKVWGSAKRAFEDLWDSINAKSWPKWARRREDKDKPTDRYAKSHPKEDGPLSWAANPWVWVVKFQLVK